MLLSRATLIVVDAQLVPLKDVEPRDRHYESYAPLPLTLRPPAVH